MIIAESVYVFARRGASVYQQKGSTRIHYLFTSTNSHDFRTLLDVMDKPLYCYHLKYTKSSVETLDKCLTYLNELSGANGKILMIPWLSSRTHEIAIASKGHPEAILRDLVAVTGAAMYSKDHPKGVVDPAHVKSPVALIREGRSKVDLSMIASAKDISTAIWKSRGRIKLITSKQIAHIVQNNKHK